MNNLPQIDDLSEDARGLISDPFSRALILAFVGILLLGAVFYQVVEGWGWVNSFYFCAVTLSTIGYGDLHPTTDLSKIFTIFYCLTGIGIMAAFITNVAARGSHRLEQRIERRMAQRAERDQP